MKKILSILLFVLAFGMNAQVQTFNTQVKLNNVPSAGIGDTLVLVQGTDKTIKKVGKSTFVTIPITPNLQAVTTVGAVTDNKIKVVDIAGDSLAVISSGFISVGDLGTNYDGNFMKYATFFDPDVFNENGIKFSTRVLTPIDELSNFTMLPSNVDLTTDTFNIDASKIFLNSGAFLGHRAGDIFSGIIPVTGGLSFRSSNDVGASYSNISVSYIDGIRIWSQDESALPKRGLVGMQDFTPNITELDFTQKKYVDNNFVPIDGTQFGNPISGSIQLTELGAGNNFYINGADAPNDVNSIDFAEGGVSLNYKNSLTSQNISILVGSGGIIVEDTNPSSKGLGSVRDFTSNITNLDYTQKKYVDNAISSVRPYKVYTALLTQSGTSAPTDLVLEDTIDTTGWTRTNIGTYVLTFSSPIDLDKLYIPPFTDWAGDGQSYIPISKGDGVTTTVIGYYSISYGNTTSIVLRFYDTLFQEYTVEMDDLLNGSRLHLPEIRVYN